MEVNIFKLHTYEAQILAAVKEGRSAKYIAEKLAKYQAYCMSVGYLAKVDVTDTIKLSLYDKKGNLIFLIRMNTE